MGVRGINLAEGDRVISQSILRHLDVSAEERVAYLKRANAVRRGQNGEELEEAAADAEEAQETAASTIELGEQRYVEMSAAEQFVLTVSERGFGKRSSSYEYRITNRGGKGIVAMAIWEGKKGAETIKEKIGRLVASFPVEEADQIMLVTDGGQLIRCPVNGIRIAGRSTQGVIVFNTADDEKVVSVERIGEEGERQRRELARRCCRLLRRSLCKVRRPSTHRRRCLPATAAELASAIIACRRLSRRADLDLGAELRRAARASPAVVQAFAERGVELVDDIGRRAGRRHHAEPERRVQFRIAHLRRGRHVRQFRAALARGRRRAGGPCRPGYAAGWWCWDR